MDKQAKTAIYSFSVFIIIASMLFLIHPVKSAEEPWTIQGNSVYVNDSNIYINITPHTSNHPKIEFKTHSWSGNLDLVVGFNTTEIMPKGAYTNPHQGNITRKYICNYEFNFTTSPKFATCFKQYNSTINNQTNETELKTKILFNHSFETENSTTKTITWFEEAEVWDDISGDFNLIEQEMLGFDKWYYKQGINANAGQIYKLKLDFEHQTLGGSNKYFFGFKPSSQTIQQAIDSGTFYYIDPWTESWNANIVSYYNFTQTSGNILDAVTDTGNDLATISITRGVTGQIGNGVATILSAGQIKDNVTGFPQTDGNFSINFWSKAETAGANKHIIGWQDASGDGDRIQVWIDGGNYFIRSDGTVVSSISTGVAPTLSSFEMVSVLYDADVNNLSFWIDGVYKSSVSSTFTAPAGNCFSIGKNCDNNYAYNGTIDELGIWNKSLTPTELTNIYNAQKDGFVNGSYTADFGDTTSPTFDENPSNLSIIYGTSVSQEINGSDETEFDNYAINFTEKYTIGFTSGVLTNTSELKVGVDLINVTINDTANNIAYAIMRIEVNQSTEGFYININDTSPTTFGETLLVSSNDTDGFILYQNGSIITNASVLNLGTSTYNFTAIRNDTANYSNVISTSIFQINQNTEACNVVFNETSPVTYPTTPLVSSDCTSGFILYRNNSIITNNTQTALGSSTYNFTVIRNDTTNYSNIYDEETFQINKGTLIALINSSTGSFTIELGTAVNISYNETIIGDDDVNYTMYNDSIFILNNTEFNDSIGTYQIVVNSTGGANYSSNINISTQVLTYQDTTAPTITLPVYTNATLKKNTQTLTLNISVLDFGGFTNSVCNVDINGTNQTFDVDANNWCNFTVGNLTNLADGNSTINVYVNDTSNNRGLNNSFVVYIDTIAPILTINNPTGVDETASPTLFKITTNEISSCIYSTNGGSNTSLTTSDNLTHTKTEDLSEDTHTTTFYCNDTILNSNSDSIEYLFRKIGMTGGGSGGGGFGGQFLIKEPNITLISLEDEVVAEIEQKPLQVTILDNVGAWELNEYMIYLVFPTLFIFLLVSISFMVRRK